MKKLVLGTVLALVALTLPLGMAGTQVAQAAGPVTTVYNSIQPSAVDHNVPSQAFQAQQTDEFGDIVRLAPGPRVANELDVQMSSWACETGSGATCTTIPGHTFSHPITVTLYEVGPGDTPGPVILTKTQAIDVPYRPSYDPACGAPGTFGPWQNTNGDCFNGLAFTAQFDISSPAVVLPSSVMVGIAFNTETWGAAPIGTDGPYDSLNVGLNNQTPPSVGRDVDSDAVMWNTHTPSYYSTACPGATFCEDTNWAPYVPAMAIKTTANSVSSSTQVVDSTHAHGWALADEDNPTASHSLSSGPAGPPLGSGSLHQLVGANGDDDTAARNNNYEFQRLDDVTSLKYSTYVSANQNCQATYLSLGIENDGLDTGNVDNRIYFEPCYQSGGYQMQFPGSSIPDQGAFALNTWQTWDATAGGWWDGNGELSGGGGPPLFTLADYLNAHPDAEIVHTSTGPGVRFFAGGGAGAWDNFSGAMDAVTIGTKNATSDVTETTFDFEGGNLPVATINPAESITEGDSGTTLVTVPVTLSTASIDPTDIHWSTGDGSATQPADYTNSSGTVHFDAGSTTATPGSVIKVPVKGDTLDEANETFTVTLDSPVNATIAGSGTSTVTINDDDNAPRVTINGASKVEGDVGNTSMKFKVAIPHPSGQAISVDYHTANGTAIGGQDFVKRHGTVTIPIGKRHVFIHVPIKGDTLVEANESFSVGISNPVNTVIRNGAATGVILNDD